jgi:hypothetical protein
VRTVIRSLAIRAKRTLSVSFQLWFPIPDRLLATNCSCGAGRQVGQPFDQALIATKVLPGRKAVFNSINHSIS